MLWSSLDIAKDGLVHYAELFDYFMHRSKKHKPEKRKSSMSTNKPSIGPVIGSVNHT